MHNTCVLEVYVMQRTTLLYLIVCPDILIGAKSLEKTKFDARCKKGVFARVILSSPPQHFGVESGAQASRKLETHLDDLW